MSNFAVAGRVVMHNIQERKTTVVDVSIEAAVAKSEKQGSRRRRESVKRKFVQVYSDERTCRPKEILNRSRMAWNERERGGGGVTRVIHLKKGEERERGMNACWRRAPGSGCH